ncbi:MAG: LacI family DNA-binding transcriptional regulator [Pseudomonadota bacterium]
MARATITSLDVARKAGVSQSAVSRVFTPGASASAATAEKVRRAADELGYRPNPLARAMITGKSRIIGLVVAYLENFFYPDVLERLSNGLQKEGYHVLVFMASQENHGVDRVVEEILDYQVDGIVLASVDLASDISDRCQSAGVPVVQFNRRQDAESHCVVTSDNYSGGRRVAEFFTAGKHERIGYIAGWESASTQRDREAGFAQGLKDAGATLFAREVGNYQLERAQDATRRMFGTKDLPDAVFVANDYMAFAAMDVLRSELGLKVPGDVSVVGYDDVPIAAWPAYDLTTIRQAADEMVSETIAILMDQIEDRADSPRQIKIDAPLILRGSARIPEGWINERV